jgi:hypothetical protein
MYELYTEERPARKADSLTAICEPENVRASASHNPVGPHDLIKEWLYLLLKR